MSAYMVNRDHIAYLVDAMEAFRTRMWSMPAASALGRRAKLAAR